MPTASDYARRTTMARPRSSGKTGPNPRHSKVRFAKKKFKKLVDQKVHHPQPIEVSRPVIVKPEEDVERKKAMEALKKSLEEFEKLHREICLICYGDRLEGGTSGISQPDESSCPGEEASETEETEHDNETPIKYEKEELASGSEKGDSASNRESTKEKKAQGYQCQKFLTPGPPMEPKQQRANASVKKSPNGGNRNCIPPKAADSVASGLKDSKDAKGTEECWSSSQGKSNSKEMQDPGDARKSTEAKYKQKLNEMRGKPCKKKQEADEDCQQCQGFLCRLVYIFFRYILLFPQKDALKKASAYTGRTSPTPRSSNS